MKDDTDKEIVKSDIKIEIEKLGNFLEYSGELIGKFGRSIRDISNKVGELSDETILSDVRLSLRDVEKHIKEMRRLISLYKNYTRNVDGERR